MLNKKKDQFKEFFQSYSKNVDNASLQFFWKLSDEIILKIISKHIKSSIKKGDIILDAGGGTGRWIEVLSKIYPSNFILYDKSSDMLEVASKKKILTSMGERLKIYSGDIQDMRQVLSNSISYVISIYSPISFVERPELFFKEIKRILKKGGIALVMGQGLPNAIASKINNYLASGQELSDLDKKQEVKWNESLAPLNVFSKESIEALASKSGLKIIKTYGIPVFLQPGPEDFDSENKLKSRVSSKLEDDKDFFKAVYDLEMKHNSESTFVNRGMNLMIVVQK